MTRRSTLLGAAVLAATASVFARPAAAATIRIVIADLVFAPDTVAIHVGDVIEWVNQDFVAHTSTARSGAFDVEIEANATATMTVTRPGTIAYYCRYHPTMTGTLIVMAK